MERRDFIKKGCGFCAGIAAVGGMGALLEGCSTGELLYDAPPAGGKISVPVGKFTKNKYLIVRVPKLEYDLLLVREKEGAFHTLAMQCTHRQQPLVVTSNGLFCNEHGSRFDLNGNVVRDPATRPLLKYKTELVSDTIVIYLT